MEVLLCCGGKAIGSGQKIYKILWACKSAKQFCLAVIWIKGEMGFVPMVPQVDCSSKVMTGVGRRDDGHPRSTEACCLSCEW